MKITFNNFNITDTNKKKNDKIEVCKYDTSMFGNLGETLGYLVWGGNVWTFWDKEYQSGTDYFKNLEETEKTIKDEFEVD